ncbi:MAG: hypothetical protein V4489_09050 [Chlamydiota bacterium]
MDLIANAGSIRQKWLSSFKAISYYNLIFGCILLGISCFLYIKEEAFEYVLVSAVGCFLCMIGPYFCYRCAYKKPGTKLLGFVLYGSIGGVLKRIEALAKDFDVLSLVFFIVELAFVSYFFYSSMKLRALNKELNAQSRTVASALDGKTLL